MSDLTGQSILNNTCLGDCRHERRTTVSAKTIARGFRAPQMTELYRLQNGQQVSDLDSETIDSFELGLRTNWQRWYVEVSVFAMSKRDSVFRDAEGFNVSGAKSLHRGVEVSINWQLAQRWNLDVRQVPRSLGSLGVMGIHIV